MSATARLFIGMGALIALLGVAAGAFGAHALKARLPADLLAIFETAARYQLFHALGLIAVGLTVQQAPSGYARAAGWSMVTGTVFFSGSLYVLALSGFRPLGSIAPLGGLAFLAGWALLAAAVLL